MRDRSLWTVIETQTFWRTAKAAGLGEMEIERIVDALALDPLQGVEIGHGLRKVRIAREGEGKSGGYRVITWVDKRVLHVLLLAALSKRQRENFSAREIEILRRVVDEE